MVYTNRYQVYSRSDCIRLNSKALINQCKFALNALWIECFPDCFPYWKLFILNALYIAFCIDSSLNGKLCIEYNLLQPPPIFSNLPLIVFKFNSSSHLCLGSSLPLFASLFSSISQALWSAFLLLSLILAVLKSLVVLVYSLVLFFCVLLYCSLELPRYAFQCISVHLPGNISGVFEMMCSPCSSVCSLDVPLCSLFMFLYVLFWCSLLMFSLDMLSSHSLIIVVRNWFLHSISLIDRLHCWVYSLVESTLF